MPRATLFVFSLAMLVPAAGCGGSASETPFPPEPLDVNLEAEDMATSDPYRAARPNPPAPATSEPAQSAPARAAPPPAPEPAGSAKPKSPATSSTAAW